MISDSGTDTFQSLEWPFTKSSKSVSGGAHCCPEGRGREEAAGGEKERRGKEKKGGGRKEEKRGEKKRGRTAEKRARAGPPKSRGSLEKSQRESSWRGQASEGEHARFALLVGSGCYCWQICIREKTLWGRGGLLIPPPPPRTLSFWTSKFCFALKQRSQFLRFESKGRFRNCHHPGKPVISGYYFSIQWVH